MPSASGFGAHPPGVKPFLHLGGSPGPGRSEIFVSWTSGRIFVEVVASPPGRLALNKTHAQTGGNGRAEIVETLMTLQQQYISYISARSGRSQGRKASGDNHTLRVLFFCATPAYVRVSSTCDEIDGKHDHETHYHAPPSSPLLTPDAGYRHPSCY